ncbi:GNAT family N-acetyltransferase [Actinoplanes sp. CA-142083]|uniref:GNAT family N-acetyltransferase n=1 Tax=Actinoplanes sp. CA-142083 TaxID=3239903 RepID=UPI003D8E1008
MTSDWTTVDGRPLPAEATDGLPTAAGGLPTTSAGGLTTASAGVPSAASAGGLPTASAGDPSAGSAGVPSAATVDGLPGALVRLAERCVRADGGMPLAVEPWFLRRRWAAADGQTFALRGDDGELLAAGAVCPAGDGVIVTGLVDPAARGRGLGAEVLDRGLALARSAGSNGGGAERPRVPVTVETESLTAEGAALFASRGLRQAFAEDVMRIELKEPGPANWPTGAVVTEWSEKTAGRFHAVYRDSFKDRPGFPDEPAAEWIAEYDEDDEFRPGWSVLVTLPEVGDVGFVTAALGWIVQVGVAPSARGRGIGAALMRESLARMAADGAGEAWLNVNVNNPGAAGLYRRLGFADRGRRARYTNELAS